MFKVLEFPDRDAWLAWRMTGLGASDAPIVLGISKYKKPYDLFRKLTGRAVEPEMSNPAIDRGNALEPVARDKFAKRWNFMNEGAAEDFAARNLEHVEFPFIRASLDGFSKNQKVLIEIKHQGVAQHAEASKDIIQKAHYAQIQQQLFVSAAEVAYLVSIGADETIHSVKVERNEEFIAHLVKKLSEFWGYVQTNVWPTEAPWSIIPVSHNVQIAPPIIGSKIGITAPELLSAWEEITQEIKDLEQRRKEFQEKIFELGVEVCGDFRIKTVTRKGNVKYTDIEVLKTIDLEKYRGPDVVFKQITKSK